MPTPTHHTLAPTFHPNTQISYQGVDIDFGAPFRRASMAQLVQEAAPGLDFEALMAAGREAAAAGGPEAAAAVLAKAKQDAEAVLQVCVGVCGTWGG